MANPCTNIYIKLYWREQATNLSKYINHRQIICRTVCSTPKVLYSCAASPPSPFLPPSPPVRESSTHEQPFLIRHTFKKCQKCFMCLVSAQLVQSDVHTGPIKAEGRELRVQRGGAACHGAAIWFSGWTLNQTVYAGCMYGKWSFSHFSEKSDDRTGNQSHH